jgi:hypothetical protein
MCVPEFCADCWERARRRWQLGGSTESVEKIYYDLLEQHDEDP